MFAYTDDGSTPCIPPDPPLRPHQFARPSGVCTVCLVHFLDVASLCAGRPR